MTAQTYTVYEFCKAFKIPRSTLYQLWQHGEGPVSYKIGVRTYISIEAADRWRRELERENLQETTAEMIKQERSLKLPVRKGHCRNV